MILTMWALFLCVLLSLSPVKCSLWSTGLFRTGSTELQELLTKVTEMTMEQCQKKFQWDRWNCPSSAWSSRTFTLQPTKETAYLSAATAAAMVHVFSRNCSLGDVSGCTCSPQHRGNGGKDWVWGGCSDNIEYGEHVSKKLLDAWETGLDAHTYSKLHNYNTGRQAVKNTMKKHCKCHGMSGSCVVKSCWMQLPPYSRVAQKLRQAYNRAIRIGFASGDAKVVKVVVGNSVAGNTVSEIPKVNQEDLVYLLDSPNYCLPNNHTGWKGTKGRTCSRRAGEDVSEEERKSCREVCRKCGHMVRKKKRAVVKHCNCTFKWCCEVKCESCREIIQQHFCA